MKLEKPDAGKTHSAFLFDEIFYKIEQSMGGNLTKLEKLLGYQFQNSDLLARALTHRSWAYENKPFGEEEEIRGLQNESLEFVGDSVLGLAVAEQLFKKHPDSSEGDLSLMKHRLVSRGTLAKTAKKIGLGEFLRVGRGEEKTGGRRNQALLADALEAVIAAIFFDAGYISARAFVHRILADEIREATPVSSIDFKTLLQETLQADKRSAPVYNLIKTEGPDHKPTFLVEVLWDNDKIEAKGFSIKAAETTAAEAALKKIKKKRKPPQK
ncbi:MAG: ribonuclease III [Pyrinomonadaceae bacterium]